MGDIRTICLFQSYWLGRLPLYIKYYLSEISKYEDNIVFITNHKVINKGDEDYIKKYSSELVMFEDEGYDFGMYYKYIKEMDVSKYERLTIANDSVVLFKKLDDIYRIAKHSTSDFIGLTESYSIKYHLQAYFVIFNKNSLKYVKELFIRNGIKTSYYDVVLNYEIGLTQYLMENGLKPEAIYECTEQNKIDKLNPIYYYLESLIKRGFPFIKKKLVIQNFGIRDYYVFLKNKFNIDSEYYLNLMVNSKYSDGCMSRAFIHKNIISNKKEVKKSLILKIYQFLCK